MPDVERGKQEWRKNKNGREGTLKEEKKRKM